MRYLCSTIRFSILFGLSRNLVIYSDTDYTLDKSDQKSIIVVIGLFGGGPVYWANKKQNSVSIVITKAEYIAISFTTKTS
jgi:hypothetical protein